MKICVLNRCPRGRDTVTMQYVRFLERAYPTHTFVIENVGQRSAAIEADDDNFSRVISPVASTEGVLFATPVCSLLVPAQVKRFIVPVFR